LPGVSPDVTGKHSIYLSQVYRISRITYLPLFNAYDEIAGVRSRITLDVFDYHGLVPERVENVTSVTTRRSREFKTPIGSFLCRVLSPVWYSTGAVLESAGTTTFLTATPENEPLRLMPCRRGLVAAARYTHQKRNFQPVDIFGIQFEYQGKALVPVGV